MLILLLLSCSVQLNNCAAINSVKRRILNCANRIIKQASRNLIALSFTFHAEEKITVPRVHRST